MPLIVRCPAKINTFLAVGPRDGRGWHPIRTTFQAIDLCDEMEIEPADETTVTWDVPWVPVENTVAKAIRLLGEVLSLPPLRVKVRKRIPPKSGLGGGSSDAAGLLRGAQTLTGAKVPARELEPIALALGADVPFFLIGGRAMAEGYGERLTPLSDSPERTLIVARPAVDCPTPEMYARLDALSFAWREFPAADELHNDFERVAPEESLNLIRALTRLGAEDAGLTGSGSAVFGRFMSVAEAHRAAAEISGADVWITRTLSRRESL